MSQPPRDWDKELAKIDRAMAENPAGPAVPAAATGRPAAGRPVASAPAARALPPAVAAGGRARAATWFRVLLTVALAVALPLWPYAHGCGSGLWLYLGAVAVTALSGVWAAFSAWHRRQGLAHLLALLAVAWGLVLGAREVLPRSGYARAAAVWTCG
jgi:hypothetical protein